MLYQKEKTLEITGGPSKMDVMTSIAYAYSHDVACPEFRVKDAEGNVYPIIFTGIQHEDGSGDSFKVVGVINYSYPQAAKPQHYRRASEYPHHFSGYYNTKTRKGALKVPILVADDKKEVPKGVRAV